MKTVHKGITETKKAFILSLREKTYRKQHGMFLVEGDTTVQELLRSSYTTHSMYATALWISMYKHLLPETVSVYEIKESELKSISTHTTPNGVLAVAYINQQSFSDMDGIVILGDRINDPGNLGTIIRSADWFNASALVLSSDSVDIYNPKTVSSAKGSLFRVPVIYADLVSYIKKHHDIPLYGACMDGTSVYATSFQKNCMLVVGNEAGGIRDELRDMITHTITIPLYGKAESLNVAIATSVILSEYRRQLDCKN